MLSVMVSDRGAGCGTTVVSLDLTAVIETRPDVSSGKPCFLGTRIAVDEDALVGARPGGWISGGGPEWLVNPAAWPADAQGSLHQ